MNHVASPETDTRVLKKKTAPYLENIHQKETSTVKRIEANCASLKQLSLIF